MNKKECDIIKDLLPSYVEEICSDASRLWVEEHLADCEECKKTVELLKNTEISARKLDQEGFDAAKKLKKKNQRQSVLNYGLCLLLVILMFVVFSYDYVRIPLAVLYAALPICMVATWLVTQSQSAKRIWDKWDTFCLIGTLMATVYGAVLLFYGSAQIVQQKPVFGVPWNQTGQYLFNHMVAAAVISFGIYLFQVVRTLKKGRGRNVLLNLCLIGIFLMMAYCIPMGELTDLDQVLIVLKQSTLMTLGIGLVGTIVFALGEKRENKSCVD